MVHQPTHRIVRQHPTQELLAHPVCGFAAKAAALMAEVGFKLIKHRLDFPALVIDSGQLQRRGADREPLHKKLKRRNAIEPVIGHLKSDGRLSRNFLKGAAGDAMNALLCGAGHNIRKMLRQLALFIMLRLMAIWRYWRNAELLQRSLTVANA